MLLERFRVLGMWEAGEQFRAVASLKSAWATNDESAIAGVYFVDEEDVFLYVLLTRDTDGRYQGFFMPKAGFPTARLAEASARGDLAIIEDGTKPAPEMPPLRRGVDLFQAGVASKPNRKYESLRDRPVFSAAKGLMTHIARWFDDLDGNFVKDFQTTGFDSRLWELFLFCVFNEMAFTIDRTKAVPDFRLSRGGEKVFVEAVTANPTAGKEFDIDGPPPPPPDDYANYLEHVMPQKFGSPLRSKVQKQYWADPEVAGHPFVLALADFHAPASMVWSHTALSFYLYGVGVELNEDRPNYKKAVEKKLGDHVVGSKIVPTNFFGQDEHRDVSAILFSNAGTHGKFNRMGVLAGFGNPRVVIRRKGGLYDYTPGAVDPLPFDINIEDPAYEENWSDEIEIYHNPRAKVPLDHGLFPSATHFFLDEENELRWHGPERRVLFSYTHTLHLGDPPDTHEKDVAQDSNSEGGDQPTEIN